MASKVVLVTGSSRGIGKAIVGALAGGGQKVVGVARTKTEDESDGVTLLALDMTEQTSAKAAVDFAIKTYGKLDSVIVNHGVLKPMATIANASMDEWKYAYDVNLFSALALVKEAIPHLRRVKGSIIFISSGAATSAYTSWGAYGSSKAALLSLAAHVAVEEPDIASISVAPGRVDTDMQQTLREHGRAVMKPDDYADFLTAFETGELFRPEQPAAVIASMVADPPRELSGKFVKWNGPELAKLRESS